jgi:AAA+ ATPase superfamily predicted ATPase
MRESPVQPASGKEWEPSFLDRKAEVLRLRARLAGRESLLIWGPAGIGKTALVMEVLKDLPPAVARATIYLSGVEGLQPLLRSLLGRLYQIEDSALRRQLGCIRLLQAD